MKNDIPNINFEKIWKNTSYEQAFTRALHYRLLHYSTKTNPCISALETLTLNGTTADTWKITFIYSYNALE